jgi:hypothetical protein
MSESKEFELSIIGWWCVFRDDKPIAAFWLPQDAALWVAAFQSEAEDIQIRQIRRKIPFE